MTTPQEVADVLERAADLIEPPGAWTQGAYARDKDGHARSSYSPTACCYCMVGAVSAVVGIDGDRKLLKKADQLLGAGRAGKFNDAPGRTQAEVVQALRDAAKKAREAVS